MTKLDVIATYVIAMLKSLCPDMIISRYDSITTNSIYLKFDHGMANSLRISDHPGKKNLSYKYNILTDIDHIYATQDKCTRTFYPCDSASVNSCVRDIIQLRDMRLAKYGVDGYKRCMLRNLSENRRGFWIKAHEV